MHGGRLAAGGAVGDALPDEALEAVDLEAPPAHPAGEDHRARAQHLAAVEVDLAGARVESLDRARDEDLGAEPARLLERASRELVPGDAGGEAEVVLDLRGGARLAAGRLPLDDDRAQALRGAVDRGRQSRRAAADDHRVVLAALGLGREADQLGDPAQRRPQHGAPADHADHRALAGARQRPLPLRLGVRRLRVKPAMGDLVSVEEPPQLGGRRIEVAAEDDRARRRRLGGDPREPARPADPLARHPPHLLGDLGLERRDRVVVLGLEPQDARGLRGAEADREHGPERDRHLAEEVAGSARAEHAVDAVHELDRFDRAADHGEERSLVALVRRVLARHEAEVGGDMGQPLTPFGVERREGRNRSDLFRRDHWWPPPLVTAGQGRSDSTEQPLGVECAPTRTPPNTEETQ